MKSILISILLAAYFITVADECFAQSGEPLDSLQTTDNNLGNAKKPVIPSGRTILADMKTNYPQISGMFIAVKA